MNIVALITWITAAGAGMYLLSIWLIEYDKDFQAAAATRLPPAVLASHVLLALGGLIVWAAYLFFREEDLTWIALAALALAATLGIFMASRWVKVYRAGRAMAAAGASLEPVAATQAGGSSANARVGAGPRADRRGRPPRGRAEIGPPERNFPLPVVIAHGLFAFVTITLVMLVAFGVGD